MTDTFTCPVPVLTHTLHPDARGVGDWCGEASHPPAGVCQGSPRKFAACGSVPGRLSTLTMVSPADGRSGSLFSHTMWRFCGRGQSNRPCPRVWRARQIYTFSFAYSPSRHFSPACQSSFLSPAKTFGGIKMKILRPVYAFFVPTHVVRAVSSFPPHSQHRFACPTQACLYLS